MKYILEGDPVAWARAGRSKNRFYDTQKQLKLVMGIAIRNQHNDRPFYEGPLILEATFYMPIPKRVSKPDTWEGKPTNIRPDLSNLIKLLEDTCTNILYHDDCIIQKIIADRVYSVNPRTEFLLREVDGIRDR